MSFSFQNIEYSLYILSFGENMNFCHRGASNKRVTYLSTFFRISVTGVKEIRATYISKFFVPGENMNFCHRDERKKSYLHI